MTGNLGVDIEREPDLLDQGAQLTQDWVDDEVAACARAAGRGLSVADSAKYCAVCGEPIDDRRRQARPGVQTCVDCQRELEQEMERAAGAAWSARWSTR